MSQSTDLQIFDTTLRDGEQSPGAAMTAEAKLQVAEQLVRLQVNFIEAGFPAASPDDMKAVTAIAQHYGKGNDIAISAFARATPRDIDLTREALRAAERPAVLLVMGTSDIHLKYKFKMSREEALEKIKTSVKYARNLFPIVEFAPEDATRSDWEYLCRVCEEVIKAGATIVTFPDTVGYTTPDEYEALYRHIQSHVSGIKNVILGAHCHDDLGLATANTLAAIKAGARHVHVTINGIGERAGNASLEEVIMALHTRPESFGGHTTRINTRELVAASQLVSHLTGIPVQPNKAIVGANAFAHEAGIHQDGILKNRQTYEILTPEVVGWTETRLVLGKHSGRHGLDAHLRKLGYKLGPEQLQKVYSDFIVLADQKKHITDEELVQIVERT